MIRTELEYCTLGVIWQRGPCSAYAVRAEFAKSPSAHWSASAGSIYPVVERLIAAGLVAARSREGRPTARDVRITPRGLEQLRRWIERLDRSSTSATYDSVRTRFLFIQALADDSQRRVVLDRAAEETKVRLAELTALGEPDEPMEVLARLGARYELEARLAWLAEIRRRLLPATAGATSDRC